MSLQADTANARFDVVVVGGGPAGLAAAACAGQSKRVALIDDNPQPGGQIWRSERSQPNPEMARWLARLGSAKVTLFPATQVLDARVSSGTLLLENRAAAGEIQFEKLILATGARERFLPFPGWTLPNVMGAGGLQALVKGGLSITRKRIVVAGSGPLLLAVACFLRKHGAQVVAVCEQASRRTLARLLFQLTRYPAKIRQALQLRRELAGIPLWQNSWPVRAVGQEKLERVLIHRDRRTIELPCDYLACGFHLVPNNELAMLLGCRMHRGFVAVDEQQQTSVSGVFSAGETTGIGGLEAALIQGEIAGLAAAGHASKMGSLHRQNARWQRFAAHLETAFALRPELRSLAEANTIVCRCEDVTHARLGVYHNWRDAKNQTRCGMGPCQGRICGAAAQFLYSWNSESVRPPVYPARLATLAAMHIGDNT